MRVFRRKRLPTLLVLAAGIGSRFGGLKQMEPVGPEGEFLLDYLVYDGLRAGFEKVVFVIRKDFADLFRQKLSGRYENRMEVHHVHQDLDALPTGCAVPTGRAKPWGTGHAVLVAREAVQEPFAMINADDYYGPGSFRVMNEYLRRCPADGMDYAFVAFNLGNTLSEHGTVSRGVCTVRDGYLAAVREHTAIRPVAGKVISKDVSGAERELSPDTPVSMNMWGFTPRIFATLEEDFRGFLADEGANPKAEFFISTVVDSAIRTGRGRVRALPTSEKWFGVTYREDKSQATESFRRLTEAGVYPRRLWS